MSTTKTNRPKCRLCAKDLLRTERGWVCEDMTCQTGLQHPKVYGYFAVDIVSGSSATKHERCAECDGSGVVDCDECCGIGESECDMGYMHECDECDGSGEQKCSKCKGTGKHSPA